MTLNWITAVDTSERWQWQLRSPQQYHLAISDQQQLILHLNTDLQQDLQARQLVSNLVVFFKKACQGINDSATAAVAQVTLWMGVPPPEAECVPYQWSIQSHERILQTDDLQTICASPEKKLALSQALSLFY